MNNLFKLKKELKLTNRDIEKYTGISYSTVSLLGSDTRPFREKHIELLTTFFNVTSDYLLGKSDTGFIVSPKNFDEEMLLNEEDYFKLKGKGKVNTEIIKLNSFSATIHDGFEGTKVIFQPPYSIVRNADLGDLGEKKVLRDKLNALVDDMSTQQIVKTIDFVKNFIL